MKCDKSIVICGGDKRQKYLYELMVEKGLDVSTFALERDGDIKELTNYDVVILPVPVTKDGVHLNCPYAIKVEDVIDVLCKWQIVLGGMCKWDDMIDYYKDEDFQMQNAVPTAEGALQIAMENMDITINNSVCAVMGYGRIGKVLSDMLKKLGASVTVCARNPKDLALAKAMGFGTMHINRLEHMEMYDALFNTVPENVLTEEVLKTIRNDAVITELASKPYGMDIKKAEELGKKVIPAPGLPGKVAPKTAAKILCDVILDILGGMENGT